MQPASAGALVAELPFTARFENAEVRSLLGQEAQVALMDEFVVVQGVVDLVVVLRVLQHFIVVRHIS